MTWFFNKLLRVVFGKRLVKADNLWIDQILNRSVCHCLNVQRSVGCDGVRIVKNQMVTVAFIFWLDISDNTFKENSLEFWPIKFSWKSKHRWHWTFQRILEFITLVFCCIVMKFHVFWKPEKVRNPWNQVSLAIFNNNIKQFTHQSWKFLKHSLSWKWSRILCGGGLW